MMKVALAFPNFKQFFVNRSININHAGCSEILAICEFEPVLKSDFQIDYFSIYIE